MDRQRLLKSVPQGEERLLLARALDQAMASIKRRQPMFTDFMDCAKCMRFAQRLRGLQGLEITLFGGMDACERQMMGFSAEGEIAPKDFPICAVKIRRRSKKFGQSDLSHRDYLGSILGLGIERSRIGDILVSQDTAVCFVAEEMTPYICASLEQVSKTAVIAEQIEAADIAPLRRTEERRITVASLRLDAVAGEVFHLARGRVQTLIGAEKASVNWTVVTNASHPLKEGDMISLRGCGRFRLGTVGGRTKKDRIALEIEQYI